MSIATPTRTPRVTVVQGQNDDLRQDIVTGKSDDVLLLVDLAPGGMRGYVFKQTQEITENGPDSSTQGSVDLALLGDGGEGDGYLRRLVKLHGVTVVRVSPALVRAILHSRGQQDTNNLSGAKTLARDLDPVVRDLPVRVSLVHATHKVAPAGPPPELPPIGGEILGDLIVRGTVTRDLPPEYVTRMAWLMDAIHSSDTTYNGERIANGTCVSVQWQSPDRLLARKHRGQQTSAWIRGHDLQTADLWLTDVLRGMMPVLLLVDSTADGLLTSLDELAVEFRLGVVVVV